MQESGQTMLSWKAVLKELKKKPGLKSTEFLVLVAFFLFSLRVLNWFQYPYIVVGGDFRPPLVHEAFVKRVLYTWDETDFGIPSVYSPRILDPFYFLVTALQALGVSLYLSQIIAVFLMYFLASIFMYLYVKQLTNGDITAAFIAALFLTSNVHLIIDREQTAIGFIITTLMILPCLVTFTKGIKTESYKLMIISGLLFVFTYGVFPNYRVTLLCLIALAVTCLFIFINNGLTLNYYKNNVSKFLNISINTDLISNYLKLLSVFVTSLLLASISVTMLVLVNHQALLMTYNKMAAPPFTLKIRPHDVLRLIAKWSFYEEGIPGKPYVPYANVYSCSPLIIILSYLPSVLAFTSLLNSKPRKLTIYFSGIATLFLLLTDGFNPYFSQLYFALATNVPLMIAFRESTHWIFFVIMSYGILIGTIFSYLCYKFRNKILRIFAISLIIALFISTSFPLITGDVTRNWLNPEMKGTYFPPSYVELNRVLPSEFWSIMLPQRRTYIVYNFTEGIFGCGNPYPLIFSKPIISGAGTEYIQSGNLELINELHKRIRTNIKYKNVAPKGKISASSSETNERTPDKAIDGKNMTRWASKVGVPQWLEIEWNKTQELSKIKIFFQAAYADEYRIETWNGSDWTTLKNVENNISTEFEYAFPKAINTTKLRLFFTKASPWGLVSIRELEVYARTEGVPKLLGMLGIKYLILEKNIMFGNTYPVNALNLYENKNFILVKEWEEVALFENSYALKKLYVADDILNFSTLNDMYELIENSEWNTLKHSVFINTTSPNEANKTLIEPKNFIWRECSPTKYEANVESNGSFILVLLESYDKNWKAYVNGTPIPEKNHLEVNAFANGWLIDTTGNLTITIQYETQGRFTMSLIASVILLILLLTFLSRKDVKRVAHTIQRKFKRKTDQTQ